jgi:AcrR family transcriptional regulator
MRQPPRSRALPAMQRRSEATRDRLLDAAEWLLGADGPDGATVPRIAARAKVAVGSVYRRFPDKDALLRAVYERFFDRSVAQNDAALSQLVATAPSTSALLTAIVEGLVRGYRAHRGLLAALVRYAEQHPDAAFRRSAERARDAAMHRLSSILMSRAHDMTHPALSVAIPHLMATLGVVARAAVLDRRDPWRDIGDDTLIAELSCMARQYLGVN